MNGVQQLTALVDAVDVAVPADHRRRIAIVGAGAIVENAHLPAYRAAGLEVVGIFDLDGVRAKTVAETFDLPRVYSSLEELLADPQVEVVDIAVVADAQPAIVRAAIAAGKDMLCQKPFAPDLDTADELIALAAEHGRKIAVNQQMRFDEGVSVARAALQAGWIGEATTMSFHVDIATDFSAWPWLVSSQRLEISYHSIHYLDAIRSILGDPVKVFCAGSRRPGQVPLGETRTMSTLLFAEGTRAVLHVNHENLGGDHRAEFRLDGSQGSVRGTLGLLYDYPRGRPDTAEIFSRTLPTDGWLPYPVTRRWIPDAFIGPMAGLLRWIATGEQAPTAAADNVKTLALVEALYASMETGETQVPRS